MSGKRLLDAVAILKASRAVASQHLSIRLKQLDVYSKTSTLAKAVKKQTGSAAQASLASAQRFTSSGNRPSALQTYSSNSSSTAEQKPSVESVQDVNDTKKRNEGLEQDHHYRPEDNSVVDDVPKEELDVQQEKSERYPSPDGTIPTGEAAIGEVKTDRDVYNHRSAGEPAKKPLEQNEPPCANLEPESSRRSSIPDPDTEIAERSGLSSKDAKILQRKSESQIPSKAAEPPGEGAYKVNWSTGDDGPEIGVDQERDTFYRAPNSASPVLSALPRVKLPKNTGDVQGGDSHIKEKVNADVFYSSGDRGQGSATMEQNGSQEPGEPSEEMVNQIFHSPRVARILGSKGQFGSLKPKNASSPRRKSTIAGQGNDKDVSSASSGSAEVVSNAGSGGFKPAPRAGREKDEINKLAADIENDARATPNVSMSPFPVSVPC